MAWIGRLVVVLLSLALAACAGTLAYDEGRKMMAEGDLEGGIAKMEAAARENPKYRPIYERDRNFVVARFVSEGDMLRGSLRFDEAEAAYRRALKLDPSSARAQAGLATVEDARKGSLIVQQARADFQAGKLDKAESALREVLAQDSGQREARELLNVISERRAEAAEQAPAPALKGPFTQPITLEFRDASLKSVFEVISRASGINFVFDRDVRSDTKINIFVRNTSLDDVVKLILVTNQLERKLLNENTVLIYPNTPAKQKEYKELVVRSFYLANADVKQALNMVKGMVKTPDVFIDEKLNLLVVKDTPDAVRLIGRLMRSLDVAEPEVMLEVEVLELATSRLQSLGIRYPEQINLGKIPTTRSTGDGTDGGTTPTEVFEIGQDGLKAFTLNPPLVIDLLSRDADVKVLANPRIRVKNREKAKVHIGDRLPVITTTSTANVGVSSSVSYLDVGLKLDVEPNIYLRNEVSIKVGLEVSNIRNIVNVQGTRAYELGTRNTGTVLQLKDGETQILAGLISDEDRRSASKLPWLGDLPVLGRLFGTQEDDRRRTEIVMLLTPRIVRSLTTATAAMTNVQVGTDAAIGNVPLRIAPTAPGTVGLAPGAGGQVTGAAPVRPMPLPEPGVAPPPTGAPPPPTGAPPSRAAPEPPEEGEEGVPQPEGPSEASSNMPSSLLLAAPLGARAGSEILVSMSLAPGGSATRANAEISYDPLQLEPVGVQPPAPGRLPVRVDGSSAVRFRVLVSAGRAQLRLENVVGTNEQGEMVPVAAPGPVDITVGQ